MTSDPWHQLRAFAAEHSLVLTDAMLSALRAHWRLVEDANRTQNLTSIAAEGRAAEFHYLDSLAVLWCGMHCPEGACRALDAGSGAGFPGIPLKIVRPDWDVTLADARLRRVRFLERCIAELGLSGCRAVHARLGKGDEGLDGRFDLVLARAFADPAAAVRDLARSLAPGGRLALYTTRKADEDVARIAREATKRHMAFAAQHAVPLPTARDHVVIELVRSG